MATRKAPQEITRDNIDNFMQQFDAMICDCDGVLWLPLPFPNTQEAFARLKKAGKKILFVTNNSLAPPELKLIQCGFPVQKEDASNPPVAISKYLKKVGLKKKAYVIGSKHLRAHLQEEGISIVPAERTGRLVEESYASVLGELKDDPEIGAVIVDADINATYMDYTRAVNYLKRPDCLFLAGASDTKMPKVLGIQLIGPGHFLAVIEKQTGRKAEILGKPAPNMVLDHLKDVHSLDLNRTIFVGDSLEQDMGIGSACGMKTLMVLTGQSQLKDVENCDPTLIPDFYIKSFGDFAELLSKL